MTHQHEVEMAEQVLAAARADVARAERHLKHLRMRALEESREPTIAEAVYLELHKGGIRIKCPKCRSPPGAYCKRPNGTETVMHTERLQAGKNVNRKVTA